MSFKQQHELIKDCSLTLAHVFKKYLPDRLGTDKIEVVFDFPDPKKLAARKAAGVLLGLVLLSVNESDTLRSNRQPLVREEDDDGNIVEFRAGTPTFVSPRYLVTVWDSDALECQVVLGAIMQHFFSYSQLAAADLQGNAMYGQAPVNIDLIELDLDARLNIARSTGLPFRPSVAYETTLRMDSARRKAIKRVYEKVNVYRKLEG